MKMLFQKIFLTSFKNQVYKDFLIKKYLLLVNCKHIFIILFTLIYYLICILNKQLGRLIW